MGNALQITSLPFGAAFSVALATPAPRVAARSDVEAAQGGDRRSTEALLRGLAPSVLTLARAFVGPDEAEDAAQDALVRILGALHRFDASKGSFRAWAFMIARNVCRDRLRARRAEPMFLREGAGEGSAWEADAPREPSPEEAAMQAVDREALERALGRLPVGMRTALTLFHGAGASYEEIHEALDVPMGTVMTWLHRGRARLREELERQAAEAGAGQGSGAAAGDRSEPGARR